MASRVKDRPPLEVVSSVDGGWYDGDVFFDGSQLRVHFATFRDECDEFWDWKIWKSSTEVQRLVRRRSRQLQDHQCEKVVVGMIVCANYLSDDGKESKYFDAKVLSIHRSRHSHFKGGRKEICNCRFRMAWKKGPEKDREVVVGCPRISFINRRRVEKHPDVQRAIQAAAVITQDASTVVSEEPEMPLSTSTDEMEGEDADTVHDGSHISGVSTTVYSADFVPKLQNLDAFQDSLGHEINALHTVLKSVQAGCCNHQSTREEETHTIS